MAATQIDVQISEAFSDLFRPARYKAFFGGRGSAKSHSFAKALLLEGGQTRLRILCAREIQRSIKDSVKALLDDQVEQLGMSSFYESTRDEIRGQNGTMIIFSGLGHLSVDQIKSYEGIDRCWVEEAQTISERSLEILIPTIRSHGSELWFSWNPRHQSDPVDQRFRGLNPPTNTITKQVNYTNNPFFPDVLEQERQYDYQHSPDRYSHIWLGDYEPQAVGAIWTRQLLHDNRVGEMPEMERILVAVDHAVSSEPGSNEHGIIVVGKGADGRGYVLDDLTIAGSPHQWATRVLAAYDKWEADAIVIERNQGGDLVKTTLESVRKPIPVIEVTASRGKHVRAEPISSLYALGRVGHVGSYPELEAQMCLMTAGGYEGEGSPDRVDAMVWGMTELFPSIVRRKQRRPNERPPQNISGMG